MFKTYGSGSVGLKVEDYQRHMEMLSKVGFDCIGGHVILSDLFFVLADGLSEDVSQTDLLEMSCPEEIARINNSILAELEIGTVYAVRSSALSERGGTGIYHTDFVSVTGHFDLDFLNLWEKELSVYASEFSPAAKTWREKTGGRKGMAIWITEVVGVQFNGYFLPPLSGTAYVSYQGLPTVRVVAGLGTKAANGQGILYNSCPADSFSFSRAMWDQEEADALDMCLGDVESIVHNQDFFPRIGHGCLKSLFEKMDKLKEFGNFYLEWVALDDDTIFVVQCAPYEDKNPGVGDVDFKDFFFLAQSSDVFNSGLAECRGVVFVSEWTPKAANVLKSLNSKISNYLLIVTQDAFSLATSISCDIRERESIKFGFEHFSNALALLERKIHIPHERRLELIRSGMSAVDHTQYEGQGASHFQQLCSRIDILFIGAEIDIVKFLAMPGAMRCGEGILAWDVMAKVVVDSKKKSGAVYLGKNARNVPYSYYELTKIALDIRQRGNELCDDDEKKANSFYEVSYAIGVHHESLFFFDPFLLDPETVNGRGMDNFKKDVVVVMNDARIFDKDDIVRYLELLLERLKS